MGETWVGNALVKSSTLGTDEVIGGVAGRSKCGVVSGRRWRWRLRCGPECGWVVGWWCG